MEFFNNTFINVVVFICVALSVCYIIYDIFKPPNPAIALFEEYYRRLDVINYETKIMRIRDNIILRDFINNRKKYAAVSA